MRKLLLTLTAIAALALPAAALAEVEPHCPKGFALTNVSVISPTHGALEGVLRISFAEQNLNNTYGDLEQWMTEKTFTIWYWQWGEWFSHSEQFIVHKGDALWHGGTVELVVPRGIWQVDINANLGENHSAYWEEGISLRNGCHEQAWTWGTAV